MVQYIDAHCHLSHSLPNIKVGAVYNAARQSDWGLIASALNIKNNVLKKEKAIELINEIENNLIKNKKSIK